MSINDLLKDIAETCDLDTEPVKATRYAVNPGGFGRRRGRCRSRRGSRRGCGGCRCGAECPDYCTCGAVQH